MHMSPLCISTGVLKQGLIFAHLYQYLFFRRRVLKQGSWTFSDLQRTTTPVYSAECGHVDHQASTSTRGLDSQPSSYPLIFVTGFSIFQPETWPLDISPHQVSPLVTRNPCTRWVPGGYRPHPWLGMLAAVVGRLVWKPRFKKCKTVKPPPIAPPLTNQQWELVGVSVISWDPTGAINSAN